MNDIKVIAFDIDGTLYPLYRLYIRMMWYFVRHVKFFYYFGRVRKTLRRSAPLPDLYHYQAILLSEHLHCTTPEAKKLLDETVYLGLRKYFLKIKPYKNIEETFKKLKEAGYRIALLSDFPPEQKGNLWGLIPYCDVLLSSEKLGALKPSKYAFGLLANSLNVPLENILYVGDQAKYDIWGAKNAGMRAAYKEPLWRSILHRPNKTADFSFRNYRQFMDIVLK